MRMDDDKISTTEGLLATLSSAGSDMLDKAKSAVAEAEKSVEKAVKKVVKKVMKVYLNM